MTASSVVTGRRPNVLAGLGRPAAASGRRFEQPARREAPVTRPPRSVPVSRPATRTRPLPASRPVRRSMVAVAAPVAEAAPEGDRLSLRLTRRGQIVLLLIVAGLAYGVFGLGRATAVPAHHSAGDQEVVVRPGDSLWTIAVRAMPNEDPRDAVATLKSLNHLNGAQLAVGQELQVR